jgi:hypothetical protein
MQGERFPAMRGFFSVHLAPIPGVFLAVRNEGNGGQRKGEQA